MLIRVRGGNGGVFDYLRDGKKSGRNHTRAELDKRVVLAGNMGPSESIVNAMGNRGEKYLHITLAFKEDELPLDTLRAITDDFQQFCMTAFRLDEYCFHAEAHLPKIKSYTNRKTGLQVIRKPHIHIVIPELNLLSHKHLNPLGRVDQQTKYLEAFQEHINAQYGLASPKDNRRIAFTDESTLIARQKGDQFQGIGSDLKQQLLDAMIEKSIEDYPRFMKLAEGFGAVRIRNDGKPNAYLNVKPEGATKGVNLKDYVFSPEFVALPIDEKKKRLAAEAAHLAAEAAEYVEAKKPRPSPDEIADRLAEWHEIRARELKYINSGSRKLYAAYKEADSAGKLAILGQREAAFYQKYDPEQDFDADQGDTLLDDLEESGHGVLPVAEPAAAVGGNDPISREPDTFIEQLLAEHKDEVAEARLATSDEHKVIKLTLDATLLLDCLSHTHGVMSEKYPVKKGLDGGDRIQCGSRNLNVADFLTKELHLPWPEAESILREAHAAQLASVTAKPRAEIRSYFWESYRKTWPARKDAKEKDWAAQKAAEARRRTQIKAEHLRGRAAIKADPDKSPADRKAAYSLASMRKAFESAKLYREIALERQALREKHRQPGREGYKLFLVVLAEDGHGGALAELRRQTEPGKTKSTGDLFSAARELNPSAPTLLSAVIYTVDRRGNVTYYADQAKMQPILVDTGREVQVVDQALDSVETGLRLALQKFGPQLDVHGSPEFKAKVLRVVLRTGLRVQFKDPALAAELERLKVPPIQILQAPEVMEDSRNTEEWIEAEYAGEVYGLDDDEPAVYEQQEELRGGSDSWTEIDTDIGEDQKPDQGGAKTGPRMA